MHFLLSQVFRPRSAGFLTPSTFTMVSSRRATTSCTHKTWVWRCLTRSIPRQSPSTLWRPHVHVFLPHLPCQQPWPLRPELSMHSWSARKNSASPEHVATTFPSCCRRGKEMPAKHHIRRRSRPSGLHTLSEKTSTIGCSACLLHTTKHLGLPFRNRTRRFEGWHVLGVRLLHPFRKFLHYKLQLTRVSTEIAGPHRPRSAATSVLCIIAPCHLLHQ